MKKGILFGVAGLFLFSILVAPSIFAQSVQTVAPVWGPYVILTEHVEAHYYANGSLDLDSAVAFTPCTPDANPCRYGHVDVNLPNAESVLQGIKINFSSTADTNLETNNDNMAAAGVAVSYPLARDYSRIYVNTTNLVNDTYYNISDPVTAPALQLSLTYANQEGGIDLFDSDNIVTSTNVIPMTLTITNPDISSYVSNTYVFIQFALDTNGGADVVNIVESSITDNSAIGTTSTQSNDGDEFNDVLNWTGGTVPASGSVVIDFNVTIEEGNNTADGMTYVDLDDMGGAWPTADRGTELLFYYSGETLTGRTITNYHAKSSVRQGIELSQDPQSLDWRVRGFIENRDVDSSGSAHTNNLSYNVSIWELFQVDPTTGAPTTSAQIGEYTFTGNDFLHASSSRIYTTDPARSNLTTPFAVSGPAKPFYASSFDWGVVWQDTGSGEPSVYISWIETTMDLPELFKIDIFNREDVNTTIAADVSTDARIQVNSEHLGHSVLDVGYIELWSIVPANRTVGSSPGHGSFTIDSNSVEVWLRRGTAFTELTSGFTTTVNQVPGADNQNGTVRVVIPDLSSATGSGGQNLTQNDRIYVNYTITSTPDMTTGDKFNFTGNTTFMTVYQDGWGTPITEDHTPLEIRVASKRLTGFKELIAYYPAAPHIINSTLEVAVQAEDADDFIGGVFFVDYVPNGSYILGSIASESTTWENITVWKYNASNTQATELTPGTGANQYQLNIFSVILPDGSHVTGYNISKGDGDGVWSMFDGDTINMTYALNVSVSGVYIVPMILSGFDPDTGEEFGIASFGTVIVDIPEPSLPLHITDESLSIAKRVIVYKPALWVKTFEVFNPNQGSVTGNFQTEVFGDTMQVFVTYLDNSGRIIEEHVKLEKRDDGKQTARWTSVVNPLETRRYEVKVLTPPVMEIDRDVEVVEQISDKKVKLKLDIFLKNFADESYETAILNVPIGFENIVSVTDAFGNPLAFTGGADASTISIEGVEPQGLKTISIVYEQLFPTVIATPDKDRYDPNSPVNLEILVINGGDPIEHPFLEVEVYTPDYRLVYADIKELDRLSPLEKTDVYDKFVLPAVADAGFYIITVRFRSEATTLSTYTGKFYVAGVGGAGLGTIEFAVILIIGVVLLFFSVRRLREVKSSAKKRR